MPSKIQKATSNYSCCVLRRQNRKQNSKWNHLCAQMFDQSDELQGMKLKFPHLQIQLHLRQGSQSMSNDSASSIIIKDSKLQSMTNFPLRSAFEFPVSSQSQRVMCAKKKEFGKNLLLLATTYQHTRLLFLLSKNSSQFIQTQCYDCFTKIDLMTSHQSWNRLHVSTSFKEHINATTNIAPHL